VGEFEKACIETELAAADAVKSATRLASVAKDLVKAAQVGDIAKIRKAVDAVKLAEQVVRQSTRNATEAWPFTPENEEDLLQNRFAAELIATASERGLKISEQDKRLVSYPSIVKVMPETRAVFVDRSKVTTLRPSYLSAVLERNQSKKPRFKPEHFLESLYGAYRLCILAGSAPVIALVTLHDALTLLPGASKDYDKTDFTRDLFALDQSRVTTTRSGAVVSFHASTGTKGSAGLLSFVSPDGEPIVYYGVKFTEVTK